MTIEQTIEIPASRRIFLDLPLDLPVGRAKMEFTITPETVPEAEPLATVDGKIRLTNEMKERLLHGEKLLSLTGILHTEMSIKEIREERLAKHLNIASGITRGGALG